MIRSRLASVNPVVRRRNNKSYNRISRLGLATIGRHLVFFMRFVVHQIASYCFRPRGKNDGNPTIMMQRRPESNRSIESMQEINTG